MLEIFLLGEIIIRLDDIPITRFRSQKELALLAYLAHTGQTHNREALADLLWEASSTKQSLSNLRTALARLRKRVGDHLIVTRKTVAITAVTHQQTDTVRFQKMLAGVGNERSTTAVNLLAQTLKLYKGEFMAGLSLPQAPRFNDWLVVEQERVRQLTMRGYRQLAGWQEERGSFAEGITAALQWAAWDPFDEMAQQQLMRLLTFDGRFSEALRVYEKYRLLLENELAISVAPSTTALYQRIQDGALTPPDISPAPKHNLPRALKPLFGRKKEIKKLADILANPEYPLTSVTGVGGIGKTSLALAVGRRLSTDENIPFKDGIWFISLEEIRNDTPQKIKEEAAAMIGQEMGLYFHDESDLWSQLLGQLASKTLLLILDNIEQFLMVASDLIVDLLEAGEGIHLLTTSRRSLALPAAISFPITGLAAPDQVSPEALQNESVRLFAERAGRTPAPFQLENHLAEVVAICQFVEGMPLGIELAAASLGRLMIDEIMPALTSNLRLLDSVHPDLSPRQRAFHAVFDYTWQLLDVNEQTVLAQISLFRGGFTRQAANAILNGSGSGLYNLQHHALVSRDETGRFRMHSLLRQLANEKAGETDLAEMTALALDRHSAYFSEFMQSFEKALQFGEGQAALQTILPEQANLRAAWLHAVNTGRWRSLANCLDGLHYFYARKGFYTEEAALADAALTALQTAVIGDDAFLMGFYGRLLTVRAWDFLYASQLEKGVEIAEEACGLAQKLGNSELEAQARIVWARILYRQSKHEPALAHYKQAVALAKIAQNRALEADGLIGISGQIIWQADASVTEEPLQQALVLCQNIQYKAGEMETLTWLGVLAMRRELFAKSTAYYEQALQLSRVLGKLPAEAELLGNLGVVLRYQDDLAGSQAYQEKALAAFRQLNLPGSEQWLLGELGLTAIRLGNYAKAEENLTEALMIAERIKDVFWGAWVKTQMGVILNEQGEPEEALLHFLEALEVAERLKNPRLQGMVLLGWGYALCDQAKWKQAERQFQTAYGLWTTLGQTAQAIPSLAGLAYAAYQQEELPTAVSHANQLWQIWRETPKLAERANLKLYWMLGQVWDGVEDDRAGDLWQSACVLLDKRSEKIADERVRRMFLEQIPAHRAILKMADDGLG